MSGHLDPREGLSPSPNVLDLLAGDGDGDGDSDVDFQPSEEQSASGTEASLGGLLHEDDSSDTDFIGNNNMNPSDILWQRRLTVVRCRRVPRWN